MRKSGSKTPANTISAVEYVSRAEIKPVRAAGFLRHVDMNQLEPRTFDAWGQAWSDFMARPVK